MRSTGKWETYNKTDIVAYKQKVSELIHTRNDMVIRFKEQHKVFEDTFYNMNDYQEIQAKANAVFDLLTQCNTLITLMVLLKCDFEGFIVEYGRDFALLPEIKDLTGTTSESLKAYTTVAHGLTSQLSFIKEQLHAKAPVVNVRY